MSWLEGRRKFIAGFIDDLSRVVAFTLGLVVLAGVVTYVITLLQQ